MANVLDVLMRVSGDSSGARSEVKKLGKEQKDSFGSVKADFAKFAKVAAAAAAAVSAALVKIAFDAADMADKFAKASDKTGESARTLSQLSYAAEIGGTSFQTLEKALLVASRRLKDAERGSAVAVDTFNQLGISIYDSSGNLKKGSDLLGEFADATKGWEDDTRKAALAQELFGRAGADLLPMLKDGSYGLQQMADEAEHLGVTLSDEAAQQGAEFNDALTRLDSAFTGLRNNIAQDVIPVIQDLVSNLSDAISFFNEVFSQSDRLYEKRLNLMNQEQKNEETVKRIRAAYTEMGGDWKEISDQLKTLTGGNNFGMERDSAIRKLATDNEDLAKAIEKVRNWRLKNSETMKNSMAAADRARQATEKNTKSTVDNKNAIETADKIIEGFAGQTVAHLEQQLAQAKIALDQMRESGLYGAGAIEEMENKVADLTEELIGFTDEGLENAISVLPEDVDIPLLGMNYEDFSESSNWFDDIGDWLNDNASGFEDIGDTVWEWTDGIASALDVLGLMDDELAGVISGVQQAAGGFAQFGSGLASGNVGDIIGGAASALGGVMDTISAIGDALTESWSEGFYKQFGSYGFDDEYSEELLDKMEKAGDAGGSKEAGIKANLEEFFAETEISNQGEFDTLSNLLNESINEYIAQGHSADEAYEKFGDELEQLTDAQEQYGFETTDALQKMLKEQRYQTKQGKRTALGDALDNLDKVFKGFAENDYSPEAWQGAMGMVDRIFKKMQQEGYSMAEIYEVVGPRMQSMMETLESQGIDTSSMQNMKDFYEKMSGSSGLFDVLDGLKSTMEVMRNTGSLTKTNYESIAATANETYQKLLDQGFTEDQALAQMAPLLAQMQEASEKLGWEIPADIAEKIEQATEKGLMPEEELPAKMDALADTFTAGTDRIVDAILGTKNSRQKFALGGMVKGSKFEPVTVDAHAGEYVINQSSTQKIGESALAAINASGALPTSLLPVPAGNFESIQESAITEIQSTQKETSGVLAELRGQIAGLGKEMGMRLKEALPNMGTTRVQSVLSIDQKKMGEIFTEMLNNQTVVVYADQVRTR